jgi:hypothetical protein
VKRLKVLAAGVSKHEAPCALPVGVTRRGHRE